jgi:predicted nucleic acid-binding protein
MSIAEMRMGAIARGWGVRRCTLLEQFIRGFGVVYADDALCTSWATLRADARAAGRSLSPQDAWIAATALGLDAPLATNNRSDFEQVQQLYISQVGIGSKPESPLGTLWFPCGAKAEGAVHGEGVVAGDTERVANVGHSSVLSLLARGADFSAHNTTVAPRHGVRD